MATRDPRFDEYIAKAAPFAQPILLRIREVVHAAVPGLTETFKWSMPHYLYNGKNLAGMAAFKAHCAMMIHGDGRQGDAMGQFGKLATVDDLPGDNELKAKIVAAKERIDAEGTALKKKSQGAAKVAKPELPVPPAFEAALSANPAAKAVLEAFAPSHRREYVQWISEAKADATRDRRIEQTIEWLAQGKKRNWKYENC
ncbi:MAG: YdeI/OmpD-associated family protein [Novosphingobium sp.]